VVGLSNNVSQILQRSTLVTMATKCETKTKDNSALTENIAVALAGIHG